MNEIVLHHAVWKCISMPIQLVVSFPLHPSILSNPRVQLALILSPTPALAPELCAHCLNFHSPAAFHPSPHPLHPPFSSLPASPPPFHPSSLSPLADIKTSARQHGEEFVLSGQKMWITNGMQADMCLVLANTDAGQDALPHRNKSLILVPLDAPGHLFRFVACSIITVGARYKNISL